MDPIKRLEFACRACHGKLVKSSSLQSHNQCNTSSPLTTRPFEPQIFIMKPKTDQSSSLAELTELVSKPIMGAVFEHLISVSDSDSAIYKIWKKLNIIHISRLKA